MISPDHLDRICDVDLGKVELNLWYSKDEEKE